MKRIVFLQTLLIGFIHLANAQTDTTASLTFKEAVKIGLENNIVLNQQENLLISSQVAKTSGLLQLGPSVSASGTIGRNDGNSFNSQEGRPVNGVRDFVSASFDASMPLFRGLATFNNYRQTSSMYEAQLNMVNRTSQDVIRIVANQYLLVLLDQQLVRINQKNLETQQKQYEQISEQVSAGSRAEVDMLNQEYLVKNAELLILRARNVLRNDKALLAQTLQLDPSISFTVEEPSLTVNSLDNLSIDELYQVAQEKRSDLTRAREVENASRFGYHATKGSYFPSIAAFASYASAYNYIHPSDDVPDLQNRPFNQQFFTDNTQLTYGVSFRIPIYSAFQNRAAVVRSRMLYENSKIETEGLENTVKSQVLLAHQNLQDARASYEVAGAQLKAAEISFNLETERYNLGVTDIVSLSQASQAYTRAQSDYESARLTLMFQQVMINYAVGTLRFEDIP